jgi:heme o synthase
VAESLVPDAATVSGRVGAADPSAHGTLDPSVPSGRSRAGWRDYLALTKPRIVELLLVTTVPAMVLAAGGWPRTTLVLATLLGGTLAAGGAGALNCYIERDLDGLMKRTARRPLAQGTMRPSEALGFGVGLVVLGVGFLALSVNLLAAALTGASALFYVVIYTIGLKRRTPSNIVIGGAAGAGPVLVGWAAVTGQVGLPALLLFAIVFVWTPPHFWALAIRHRDDYAAAGVPMLPVVAGVGVTSRRILWYSVAMVALTLALAPIAELGIVYVALATVLGTDLLHHCWRLVREGERHAMRVFRRSITYLSAVFGAVALDVLLRAWIA